MESRLSRQSNLELLRIISILFVLIVHFDFGTFGVPVHADLLNSKSTAIVKCLIECFAIIGVNAFVLISGYFGVKIKINSVMNLLFQCFFYSVILYIVLWILGFVDFNAKRMLQKFLFVTESNWFISCYLGLLVFSPMVNNFIDSVKRRKLELFIISIFLFQSYFGYLRFACAGFWHGYSILSFIIIYCIGRYIRLYGSDVRFFLNKKISEFLVYVFFISLNFFAVLFFLFYTNQPLMKLYDYNNPLLIIASVYFFLFFLKLKIPQNKCINMVAISTLAVLLFHSQAEIGVYYKSILHYAFDNYATFQFFLVAIGLLLLIYIVVFLIDQIRIWMQKKLFEYILPPINNLMSKLKL